MKTNIQPFFHPASSTISYIVFDVESRAAVIIDSPLDFCPQSGVLSTQFADQQIEFIHAQRLHICWILETHAHADHLTAASYLKHKLNAKIAVSEDIVQVQASFQSIFNLSQQTIQKSKQRFDRLLCDEEELTFGQTILKVIKTPGHTPDSLTFLIENHAFIGDTLFMPDIGSARCDFPKGSAATLYNSIQRIYALPEETILWMCHDYQPNGRDVAYHIPLKEMREKNLHIQHTTNLDAFVLQREERDRGLAVPKLLYPAIQVNLCAGTLPQDDHGQCFLKIPVTLSQPIEWAKLND